MNYIIGVGGVGSWLAPALCLLKKPENVTVIDGDRLEPKNMNRQLFTEDDIGANKAEAIARKYRCNAIAEYFSLGKIELRRGDVLLVCADNNPARLAALREADRTDDLMVIVAANETHSAEAYVYQRAWKETKADPRVYYPTITTDRTGDPQAAAIGCTGEAQEQRPQLVTSNAIAAALAGRLFVLWTMTVKKLEPETVLSLPYKLVVNMTRMENYKLCDALGTTET